ncbi:MAG: FG-GAP repeat domain-containing protein, partial [Planctomycetota bacterium]
GLGFTQAKVLSTREPGEGFIRSYGIYTGDLDDDGAPDYLIPNEVANDVRVLLDDGCANPGPMTKNPVTDFSSPSENVAQDFNGDQRMDFATAGWSADVVEILLGDGLGGFGAPLSATTGDQPRGLGVLDVDGDGDHDLVTANRSSSDMSLLINDGSGSFSLSGTFDGGGTGETSVVPSDVDNDGTWDLLVAHFTSSDLSVLSGDGTGTFVLSDLDGVGQQPWMVAAGDLDGDGFVDAATTDSGSASASVLLNDGLGALDPGSTLPIGNFSVAIDLGDLDGDGDLDLVTSSFSSQKWVGFANDGAGNFTSAFELDAKMSGSCATLVDYDRDGTLDIVGMDELADEMTFWRKTTPVCLGVQPDTCRGTLRIDNKAHAAGFGSHPPQSIGLGDGFHVGVTAAPSRTFAILGGSPSSLGIFTASGILNLQAGWGILMVRTTDDRGEYSKQFNVPTDLPIGLDVGLQVLVDDPSGFVLTNPHVLRLTP